MADCSTTCVLLDRPADEIISGPIEVGEPNKSYATSLFLFFFIRSCHRFSLAMSSFEDDSVTLALCLVYKSRKKVYYLPEKEKGRLSVMNGCIIS